MPLVGPSITNGGCWPPSGFAELAVTFDRCVFMGIIMNCSPPRVYVIFLLSLKASQFQIYPSSLIILGSSGGRTRRVEEASETRKLLKKCLSMIDMVSVQQALNV